MILTEIVNSLNEINIVIQVIFEIIGIIINNSVILYYIFIKKLHNIYAGKSIIKNSNVIFFKPKKSIRNYNSKYFQNTFQDKW